MTHDELLQREWVSALADGQLRGAEFARTVQLLTQDEDAKASWHAYHLMGDVLRCGELAASSVGDAAFVARLRQRLEHEAVGMRPQLDGAAADGLDAAVVAAGLSERESANTGNFRWKWVAGFASLAAVTVLGWQIVGALGTPSGAAQLAQQTSPGTVLQTAAESPQQIMIRDPRLDQLLAAHQQLGGTSALQMPAGFLRNATYERPAH